MFPILIPMIAGAVIGGLTNRRNPLQGAAMGAGMGALGGFGAAAMGAGAAAGGAAGMGSSLGGGLSSAGGGLLGASGGAAGGGIGGGLLGASEAGMGAIGGLGGGLSASAGSGLAEGGMSALGSMGSGMSGAIPASTITANAPSAMTQAMSMMKPVGDAMGAASNAKAMFSKPETPLPVAPAFTPMPNNNIGSLVSGLQQAQAQKMVDDQQKRMARRQLIRGGV